MKKKIVSLVLVFALALALGIGGTVAWLTAQTDSVVNTFTVGDIEIELTETGTDNAGKKNYSFIPGDKLAKDPTVTVKAGSEACYVFVKIEETNNTYTGLSGDIIKWDVSANWKLVNGTTNIYCYESTVTATADTPLYILKGEGEDAYKKGYVTVNENITETIADAIRGDNAKPQLTFDAFAHQFENTNLTTATDAALTHWGLK